MGSYEITGEEIEGRDPDPLAKQRKNKKAAIYGAMAEATVLLETGREYMVGEGPIIDLGYAIDSAWDSYGSELANLYLENGGPDAAQTFVSNSDVIMDLLGG